MNNARLSVQKQVITLKIYAVKISIQKPTWRTEKHAYYFANFFSCGFPCRSIIFALHSSDSICDVWTFKVWFRSNKTEQKLKLCDWSEFLTFMTNMQTYKKFPHKNVSQKSLHKRIIELTSQREMLWESVMGWAEKSELKPSFMFNDFCE